jgi:hypothetical protein
LAQCLILGIKNLARFVFIAGAQADAIGSLGVNAVKNSAANAATKQTVSCFHRISHATTRITETNPKAQKSNWGVTASYISFAPDAKTPKQLLHTQLGMEPMAGIERPD